MAARRGKSAEQLTKQFQNLYVRLSQSGDTERRKRMFDTFKRYMGNIERTRSYRTALAEKEAAEANVRKGDTREERLVNDRRYIEANNRLNKRTYSRSTYMGNNGG